MALSQAHHAWLRSCCPSGTKYIPRQGFDNLGLCFHGLEAKTPKKTNNWTIGPYFRIVRTFDLAPFQGASFWGALFPGLKPWAEFCSPFGAGRRSGNTEAKS